MVTAAPHIIERPMKKVPWIVEMTTLEAFRSQPTVIFACSLL
jgi:hypothetical protein